MALAQARFAVARLLFRNAEKPPQLSAFLQGEHVLQALPLGSCSLHTSLQTHRRGPFTGQAATRRVADFATWPSESGATASKESGFGVENRKSSAHCEGQGSRSAGARLFRTMSSAATEREGEDSGEVPVSIAIGGNVSTSCLQGSQLGAIYICNATLDK